ncbi:MAG: hypothetical protein QOE27_2868 [Solirubrobacteraceae bacterium]|nr:hypothetical protein [Solirubrobacteraceae bacterium]
MPEPPQSTPGWARVLLGFACIAAIVGAILVVGPAASAPQSSRRVITVEKGVVQSTVSGSGTLQPAQQLNVNFKASGTLLAVDVRPGQHVYQGQLLAELDPQAATVGVQQAQASLAAANAKLAQVQADPTTSAGSSATGSGSNQAASAASTSPTARASSAVRPVAATAASTTAPAPAGSGTPATGTTSTPAAATAPAEPKAAAAQPAPATKKAAPKQTTTATQNPTAAAATVSPATKAANIAAAVAGVASANLSLKSAQIALDDTKLYAPASGTIATLSGAQPGDTVSAGATGAASPAASSTGTGASGSSGTGSGSSSSSAFVVLVDLSGMEVVVPMGEADITKVRSGQPATVTVNAIPGSELGAHVTAVATLPTTTSGVVSYDVTLRLDQLRFGVRPGMTASAQLIVSQAQGAVSLPSAAISRSGGQTTVTVVRGGKDVVQPVVTGIVGDSATQIVSGLTAGEQVAIATATNLGGSAAAGGAAGGLGGATRALGGGGGGGGFGLAGGGGGARRGGG